MVLVRYGVIKCKLVELTCQRATNEQLEDLENFLLESEADYNKTIATEVIVELDEHFHMEIARLSQNKELIRILDNINARMRFVRTIDLEERLVVTPKNHMEIMKAIGKRNIKKAVKSMRGHIVRSREDATLAVQKAYARIYVPIEKQGE